MTSIAAHCLVKNESKYVWYSVVSVIDCVDKVYLWDTGSSDGTEKIIKEIQNKYPNKVNLKFLGSVDINEFTKSRQKMLDETNEDWIMIVDGDEVWWDQAIKKITRIIRETDDEYECIVTRNKNILGDIYHYQPEDAGMYEIDGIKGHLNIRAINKHIPGLHIEKPHGQQGFFDGKGKLIQSREKEKRLFINEDSYLHFTHVPRSLSSRAESDVPKRKMKVKYELGISFPYDYYYPEVFFRDKPWMVKDPWEKMSFDFYVKSLIQTPLRRLKRKVLPKKIGY